MDVEEGTEIEVTPDIDAVRHLNQFGTPDAPLMEIACTQDRKELVVKFFNESSIEVWPEDINPLLAPDISLDDDSTTAAKRHHVHTIRVLNAWWKGAHYVQNSDTAEYYMKLVTQAVRTSGSPYAWPKHVTGVRIDARGVLSPKDNPKIEFDYTPGFEEPEGSGYNNNKTVTLRSFATGGTLPLPKAVKRPRPNEQTATAAASDGGQGGGQGVNLISVDDIATPAPMNTRTVTIPFTPGTTTQRPAGAGSSNMDSPPFRPDEEDLHTNTPARQLALHYGDANPPPPTPQTDDNAHIQMTQSGKKLPDQGPRAGSRNRGVEQHLLTIYQRGKFRVKDAPRGLCGI